MQAKKKWWRKWISGIMRSSLEKTERYEIIEICSNRVSPLITLFRNNFYDHTVFNCYPTQFFRLFPAFSCSFSFPTTQYFFVPKVVIINFNTQWCLRQQHTREHAHVVKHSSANSTLPTTTKKGKEMWNNEPEEASKSH